MSVDDLFLEIERDLNRQGFLCKSTIETIRMKLRLLEKVALYWKDDKTHLNNDVMDHLVRIALDE